MKTEKSFNTEKSRELHEFEILNVASQGNEINFSISKMNLMFLDLELQLIKWWPFKYHYRLELHYTRRVKSFILSNTDEDEDDNECIRRKLTFIFLDESVQQSVERLKSDETVTRTLWKMIISTKKKKRVISTKSNGFIQLMIRRRSFLWW